MKKICNAYIPVQPVNMTNNSDHSNCKIKINHAAVTINNNNLL